MNWRDWLKAQVDAALNGQLDPAYILASGAMTRKPNEKFAVIHTGTESEDLPDGDGPAVTSNRASIWVYHDSGDYGFIDDCLRLIRDQLVGPVAQAGAIACVWEGDSQELADDVYGALVRNTNYRLIGRVT